MASSYGDIHYSGMYHIAVDEYVLDVLMPDLAGHDRSPSAFLVYMALWSALYRLEERSVALSLNRFSEATGLSKSAVQAALRLLKRRGLVKVTKTSPTAVPRYELVRHWLRRRRPRI
jgi:DNA-binding transcriptional ArsR family regulator